ncbi:MAG: sulfatase-like hydrolase/transferase [Planctomycetota bacterium]|jgi:arylsulfatase A-like enzyme
MRPAILSLVLALSTGAAFAAPRPNVILINIDNHDKWSLGYFGNQFIETPNIDKLFRGGIRFSNSLTAGRCTSSRSALMTGRYHARNGALGTGGAWGQTKASVTTVAHVFAKGGYQTAMFGKWHLGDTYPLRPEDRGFQEVVSCENGSTLTHLVDKKGYTDSARTGMAFRLNHNGNYEVYEGFRTDIWFRELNTYLADKRDKSRPFFVYLATVTAHGPHYGPEDLRDKYRTKYESEDWAALRKRFEVGLKEKGKAGKVGGGKAISYPYDHAADITGLDRNIGRLMEQLKALDLLENTIVIYMSDGSGSGAASIQKAGNFGPSNNPTTFFFPAWGGNRSVGELTANIDVLPTLADICGIQMPDDLRTSIDGQSFASLLGIPGTPQWKQRAYISDHQSTGERDGINKQMIFRPRNVSTVHLPDGTVIKFKSQKCQSREGAEVIARAEEAYDQWMKRVLADFPLGAFARTHGDRPVFLEGYPIVDGPAGPGEMNYFLLDVDADGRFELDANTSDEYGKERTRQDRKVTGKLTLCRKTTQGHLPVGFDRRLNGYRVLPETLARNFSVQTQEISLPATLTLKKGRYLFSMKLEKGRPLAKIRVAAK